MFSQETDQPYLDLKHECPAEYFQTKVYWDGACSADRIIKFAPRGMDGFVLGTTLLFGKGRPYGEILNEIRHMEM